VRRCLKKLSVASVFFFEMKTWFDLTRRHKQAAAKGE
jgi:hypothetical protein